MSKSANYNNNNNTNASQLVQQMNATAGTSAAGIYVGVNQSGMETNQMPPLPPPSYEQATCVVNDGATTTTTVTTNVGNYPPVQVLPTPPVSTLNRPRNRPPAQIPTTCPYNTTYVTVSGGQPTHVSSNTAYFNTVPRVITTTTPPSQRTQQQHTYVQSPAPVVIIQQPAGLGPEQAFVICPNCHFQKLTRIEYEPSSKTHLMAALLCVLGLWCCVCLPYCTGSCMNTNHYCGNCNKFLGTYGNNL